MTPRDLRRPHRIAILIRYVFHQLWEFRWSLGIFWGLVAVGGLILHFAYHAPETGRSLGLAEACYAIFLAVFFESYLTFPPEWYLQPLFFLAPIVGLGAVADSLVRLGLLMFRRTNRLPEWQRMMASLYRDHVVVVGMGKVGYQILRELMAMREPVVVVERAGAESALLDEVMGMDVPVIRGDGRSRKVLEQAGVVRARAVVLATSDDLANLDAGLTARDLNAHARVVLRLFDESLAAKVRGAFAMPAISTSQVAAPAFVAAATGRRLYQEFHLGGRTLHLIDLTVAPGGGLDGARVGQIQADHLINVVMSSGAYGVDVNPGHDRMLTAGDEILVVAPIEHLVAFENRNRPAEPAPSAPAP